MKKAIGVALLFAIGAYLVGMPLYVSILGFVGIVAVCYFGVYHRLIGTLSALLMVWGITVVAFDVPGFPDLRGKNWSDIATTETPFKKDVSVDEKLASLEELRVAGTITQAEYDTLRAEILANFAKP